MTFVSSVTCLTGQVVKAIYNDCQFIMIAERELMHLSVFTVVSNKMILKIIDMEYWARLCVCVFYVSRLCHFILLVLKDDFCFVFNRELIEIQTEVKQLGDLTSK